MLKIIIILAALIIALIISVIFRNNFCDEASEITLILGGIVMAIIVILPSRWFHSSEYNNKYEECEKITEEYESLSNQYKSYKTVNGGITKAMYNSIQEYNDKVNSMDWNFKWYDGVSYDKKDYIIDVENCPIITENPLLQPIYAVDNPHTETETTTFSETTTEAVTEEAPEIEGEVVKIDGKYYKLVPIG